MWRTDDGYFPSSSHRFFFSCAIFVLPVFTEANCYHESKLPITPSSTNHSRHDAPYLYTYFQVFITSFLRTKISVPWIVGSFLSVADRNNRACHGAPLKNWLQSKPLLVEGHKSGREWLKKKSVDPEGKEVGAEEIAAQSSSTAASIVSSRGCDPWKYM